MTIRVITPVTTPVTTRVTIPATILVITPATIVTTPATVTATGAKGTMITGRGNMARRTTIRASGSATGIEIGATEAGMIETEESRAIGARVARRRR